MFIHLGGDKMIRAVDVVAIFDISIEKSSKLSKMFLQHANQDKKIETIGNEEPKSIVLAKTKIYYSPISSSTLKKRAHLMVPN
jgi:hypothetical protein